MTAVPRRGSAYLKADAKNRASRVLYVQLRIDLLIAVILVVSTALDGTNSWGQIEWAALGLVVTKTILSTVGAFLLRLKLDPSSVPTPLPPEYPGEPNEEPAA